MRKLGEGATEKDLYDAYPRLTADDIRAVIYAADMIAHDELIIPASASAKDYLTNHEYSP